MNILMVGYSFSPLRGSEPGSTWNWASRMSANHDVWLITYPHYRDEVDAYLIDHSYPRLHIHWVELNPRIDPWNPTKSTDGLRGRLSYLLWHHKAYAEARRLHELHHFDVVHHISWNTISVPPPIKDVGIPFIWGPMGGGQVFPRRFYRYIGKHRFAQAQRTVRVQAMPFFPPLRSAVRHASLILATNAETRALLQRAGAREVRMFADTGIPPTHVPPDFPHRSTHSVFTLLWAGSLLPSKCLPLALEAMVEATDLPIRMLVAGEGPMLKEWEALARRLGLGDRVTFLGHLSWREMLDTYRHADAFFFTSLKDSFGTVVAEAMGSGLPILTLDHQGVAQFVPDSAGIKASVTTPQNTVIGLANGLRFLVEHPEERLAMGHAGWLHAHTLTWEERVRVMNGWYAESIGREPGTGETL